MVNTPGFASWYLATLYHMEHSISTHPPYSIEPTSDLLTTVAPSGPTGAVLEIDDDKSQ